MWELTWLHVNNISLSLQSEVFSGQTGSVPLKETGHTILSAKKLRTIW
jgi:hypothetical protein